jgi:transcriptional regulator with XRE-family HTH domain
MIRNDEIRLRMGERIATLRKEAGLTQTRLAEITGLQQAHIARIEQGRYGVKIDVLAKIADALGARLEMNLVEGETV